MAKGWKKAVIIMHVEVTRIPGASFFWLFPPPAPPHCAAPMVAEVRWLPLEDCYTWRAWVPCYAPPGVVFPAGDKEARGNCPGREAAEGLAFAALRNLLGDSGLTRRYPA